jgi:hypothetical protein
MFFYNDVYRRLTRRCGTAPYASPEVRMQMANACRHLAVCAALRHILAQSNVVFSAGQPGGLRRSGGRSMVLSDRSHYNAGRMYVKMQRPFWTAVPVLDR